ncbi:MAG: glycosyltransferase [Deltaproteobacteria bacterium]|nr:glycosyltransferase [Deltaproteobacteria bacterium]
MNIALFYHSLVSDWNNGNAHFLRGIATELLCRGHQVGIYEPAGGWSRAQLEARHGSLPIHEFSRRYPHLESTSYSLGELDLDLILKEVDLVIVHEWNEPELVRRIGEHRRRNPHYKLLFHDTHHCGLTNPEKINSCRLENFDGVLVYGKALRTIYLKRKWAAFVSVWHEAADIRVFYPQKTRKTGDVVWIGNWGDDERTAEYLEFFIRPVRDLGLKARAYGVRYPPEAVYLLAAAGIEYCGWLPNYKVPEVYAGFKVALHIPRRPYVKRLAGIPTIRPFEALACGIALISSPWRDTEGLFTAGRDYLVARDGSEMKTCLRMLLDDPAKRGRLADHGLRTIRERHTCAHRVDQLMQICRELGLPAEKDLENQEPQQDRFKCRLPV